jgi:CheY-like chemotaxis protein
MTAMVDAKHLLLVEDDADIRSALSEFLREEGYRVDSAANGAEALDQLAHGALPRLILLDLHMPVMDGRQFRAQQRNDPRLGGIPVVMFTAGRDLADIDSTEVIQKPVDVEELLRVVGRYCA